MTNQSSQIFYIDSFDRTTGTPSDFTYTLQNIKTNNFNRICVLQAIIPKTWYNVYEPYNTFVVDENGVDTTITIPPAHYSFQEIAPEIAQLMNIALSWSYTITFDTNKGKMNFSVLGNGGIQPIIKFDNMLNGDVNPLQRLISFENNTTPFVGDALQTPNVVNLQTTNSVLLMSSWAEGDHILQDIFANKPDFDLLTFQQTNIEFNSKPLTINSNTIDIKLVDYITELPINLNGSGLQLTIVLYRYNDYYQRKIQEMNERALIKSLENLQSEIQKKISLIKNNDEQKTNDEPNDKNTYK